MITRLLYIITLLLLLTTPIAAQDDTAPFPVMDEAAVFADGVTVVERLPVLNFDNTGRQLYYLDSNAEQWVTYSYPSSIEIFIRHHLRSDGTWLLSSYVYGRVELHSIENVWLFDPITGNITKPDEACGIVQALAGEGRWIIVPDEDTISHTICFTETGERRTLDFEGVYFDTRFPASCNNEGAGSPFYPVASPDGNWLIFNTCTVFDYRYPFYSYSIPDDKIRYLGQTDLEVDEVEIIQWLDNQTFVIDTADWLNGYSHTAYYQANAAASDSIERLSDDAQFTSFFDSSPRPYTFQNRNDGTALIFASGEQQQIIQSGALDDTLSFSWSPSPSGVLTIQIFYTRYPLDCNTHNTCNQISFLLGVWNIYIAALDEEQS